MSWLSFTPQYYPLESFVAIDNGKALSLFARDQYPVRLGFVVLITLVPETEFADVFAFVPAELTTAEGIRWNRIGCCLGKTLHFSPAMLPDNVPNDPPCIPQ